MKRTVAWKQNDPTNEMTKSNQDLASTNILFSNKPRLRKKKNIKKRWWSYFKEFTANTSLHGLKYIGEGNRSIVERIWWCLMVVLSVVACGILIFKVWNKWQQSPVIVSFAETATPVWQVPFPAITICTESKVKQSVYNFTHFYHKYMSFGSNKSMTDKELEDFERVSLICDQGNHGGNVTMSLKDLELLEKVYPTLEDTVWFCKWQTKVKDCEKSFRRMLTEDGPCFSFNMLSAEELFRKEELHTEYSYLDNKETSNGWTLEKGYPQNLPLETYPARGTIPGTQPGFIIILRAYDNDFDYLCKGAVQGFKIILHTPSELPRIYQHFRVPLNQEMNVAIKPNMMTTSQGLRGYEPVMRQCYFPNERRLKYFKVYTQQNCEWECLTNYTLQACGCVPYVMPRNSSTPMCGLSKWSCIRYAKDDLLTKEIQQGLNKSERTMVDVDQEEVLQKIADRCHCLPACTTITYESEISQTSFNWKALLNAYEMTLDEEFYANSSLSRIIFYFKESQFITHKRSELYGQTDFLANCGGLLGLFLGFSFLSFIEVIYFFSLSKKNGSVNISSDKDLESHKNDTLRNGDIENGGMKKDTPKRRGIWKKSLCSYFEEFAANTSLHGLKYIGERKRSTVEKIWWCFMLILSFVACSHVIYKVWLKWQQSPVIVSFAETATPIWQVPFPAVTVCPESKVKQSVFNFTTFYRRYYGIEWPPPSPLDETMKQIFETVSLLCHNKASSPDKCAPIARNLSLLNEVTPTLEETLMFCKLKNSIRGCKTYFNYVLTEDGPCYTFNMLSADEIFRQEELQTEFPYLESNVSSEGWTMEMGYPQNIPLKTYPIRGSIPDSQPSFSLLLQSDMDVFDYMCRGPVQGFKIILHPPSDLPRVYQHFKVPLGHEVHVAIKPNMMTTSEGLRDYKPEIRQCYFSNEKRLKFFKVYSQQTCEWECLTNYTLEACGCVSFAMPRDSSVPVCSLSMARCLQIAKDYFLTKEVNENPQNASHLILDVDRAAQQQAEDIEWNIKEKTLRQTADQCRCLPACTTISYDAEISQTYFDWKGYLNVYNAYKMGGNGTLHSRVAIFFKDYQFITHKRSELYGQIDFLANCGGLLGLFLGFSFLSFIEIIYFFSLRLCCTIKSKVSAKENIS